MPIIQIVIALIVIGVVLYVISLIPMDATIKKIITVLVLLCVCLWVLEMLGVLGGSWGMGRWR